MNSKLGSIDCDFCREINSGFIEASMRDLAGCHRRIIHQNETFVVFPSVSPLQVGHLLLVPRRHVTSMIQLYDQELADLRSIRESMIDRLTGFLGPILEWEHGIGTGKCGGCGIVHAHLHLLPVRQSVQQEFHREIIKRCPNAVSQSQDRAMNDIDGSMSYLTWRISAGKTWIAIGDHESQLVRKVIADKLKIQEWNWRELFGWEDFRTTLRTFSAA